MPSSWTRLRGAVDPLVRRYGLYTAYPLSAAERVGTRSLDVAGARSFLREHGYAPHWLSAAKKHPDDGRRLHDLSYRRVPDTHPEPAVGRALARDYEPTHCQYHVHVFAVDGAMEFYSHYEARPDFLRPRPSVARLRTHYRPVYGEEYLRGVSDLGF